MPFKKMTVREQIVAKREMKRLRQFKHDITSAYSGTRIAEGELCDHAGGAIAAALKLGYTVIVRGHPAGGKKLVAAAYRIGGDA